MSFMYKTERAKLKGADNNSFMFFFPSYLPSAVY